MVGSAAGAKVVGAVGAASATAGADVVAAAVGGVATGAGSLGPVQSLTGRGVVGAPLVEGAVVGASAPPLSTAGAVVSATAGAEVVPLSLRQFPSQSVTAQMSLEKALQS